MAKPIFLVGIPQRAMNEFNEIGDSFINLKDDYHIITYLTELSEFQFKVIHDKEYSMTNLKELAKELKGKIA